MDQLAADKLAFWYCTFHDFGYLIKDHNTDDVPTWFGMCRSGLCSCSDWYRKGVIQYDGVAVTELEDVQFDYSRYGGTFTFHQYASSYQVEPVDVLLDDGTELVAIGFHEIDILESTQRPLYEWFANKIKLL